MRARVLAVALMAGLFALLANGAVAHAIPVQTAPEVEAFSLATTLDSLSQVFFAVSTQAVGDPSVDTNSPVTASKALTFNKFNPALGTLIGVTITYSTTYGATAVISATTNDDAVTITFFSDALVNHTLTGAGLIDPQSDPQTFSASCTAPTGEPCDNTTSDNNVAFNTPPGGVGLAGALASFIGAGLTFDLLATLASNLGPRISPDNGTHFAADTDFDGTLDATWNGTVSVVYTYDDGRLLVPVPLSLYLLVAGLGALALSRRRRR